VSSSHHIWEFALALGHLEVLGIRAGGGNIWEFALALALETNLGIRDGAGTYTRSRSGLLRAGGAEKNPESFLRVS